MDLETSRTDAVTVSAAQGVSAVVDGGAPETVVLLPDGGARLVGSFRSSTRKVIPKPPKQGVEVDAVQPKDPLLGPSDVAELRTLIREVLEKVPPKQPGLP